MVLKFILQVLTFFSLKGYCLFSELLNSYKSGIYLVDLFVAKSSDLIGSAIKGLVLSHFPYDDR